jgi:microcystin-dependent protein
MITKNSITQNSMPQIMTISVGTIIPYCGNNIPPGWLLCNGNTFDSTQYPVLAEILGSTYGAQVGTTITLPNFNSKAPMGSGTGTTNDGSASLTNRSLGSSVGSSTVTLTTSQTGNASHIHANTLTSTGGLSHEHAAGGVTSTINSGATTAPARTFSGSTTVTSSTNSIPITFTLQNATYTSTTNLPHNNIQRALIVKFIMKAI